LWISAVVDCRSAQAEPSNPRTTEPTVFFFFSNRLGCIGSLVISAVVTLILLLVFRII
jgi:hypothetical protein